MSDVAIAERIVEKLLAESEKLKRQYVAGERADHYQARCGALREALMLIRKAKP